MDFTTKTADTKILTPISRQARLHSRPADCCNLSEGLEGAGVKVT